MSEIGAMNCRADLRSLWYVSTILSEKDITHFIIGDVCNRADWEKAICNQDVIIVAYLRYLLVIE